MNDQNGLRFFYFGFDFRFMELASLLESGKQPKTDKSAILSDATCMLTQFRNETQKLKELNGTLEEKIKELKVSWTILLHFSF